MDIPAHRLTMTILMTPDTASFAGNVHGPGARSPVPARERCRALRIVHGEAGGDVRAHELLRLARR